MASSSATLLEASSETPNDGESIPTQGTKRSRTPSIAWEHFTRVPNSDPQMATCNYCLNSYQCHRKNSDTSNMLTHMKKCRKNPMNVVDKSQQTLSIKQTKEGREVVALSFSIEACRKALTKMVVIDELPFRFVEGEGFRSFVHVLQPKFTNLPNRNTIARDCIKLYLEMKRKLKGVLNGHRICVTTDTWTSIQNMSYICLTAHFVDKDWNLQKRIINFCQVANHKSETIGKKVEKFLLDWGVDTLFSVTVDNASSNNSVIDYLKRKTKHWNDTVLEHKHLHMRCCAHIMNLIVADGLDDSIESVARVRKAVRYVRSSPSRFASFKKCIEFAKISSEKLVCLDVQTRWNSTYMMLEAAEKFQAAFERLEDDDFGYYPYFAEWEENGKKKKMKISGPPTKFDWDEVRMFVKFLKVFYNGTKRVSGSLYVTSNVFFNELFLIEKKLTQFQKSNDERLKSMATKMKEKYDMYWSIEKINILLYVAVVLDPRFKLEFVWFCVKNLNGEDVANQLSKKVKDALVELYEWYFRHNLSTLSMLPGEQNASQLSSVIEVDDDDVDPYSLVSKFQKHLEEKDNLDSKSEVERFLGEKYEKGGENFDILGWWKNNSTRYRILSLVARDVLAIPLSSVASESAFSTGGRVLDCFRSSLAPNTVEALICTQDWLRSPKVPINLPELMDEVHQYEQLDEELLEATPASLEY